jgi:mono/diheme cytochrome c family protein
MKTLILLVFSLLAATHASRAATAGTDEIAARLYRMKCAGCHGVDGSGGVGASLKGKLRHPAQTQIFDVIKNGIPGTGMPASGLPDLQVKRMATYVLYLNKKK